MSENQKKFELVLYWEATKNQYSVEKRFSRDVLQYLVQKEKISLARDIKFLKRTIVGTFVALPENITENSAKITLVTELLVPKNWIESKELYEANKDLISPEIFNDPTKKYIEVSFMVNEAELGCKKESLVVVVFGEIILGKKCTYCRNPVI